MCSKKQHYKQHIQTKKHIGNKVSKSRNKSQPSVQKCVCGKEYQDRSGLWKHKKTCPKASNLVSTIDNSVGTNNNNNNNNTLGETEETYINKITPELIMKLIEQNQELQQTLMNQNKKIMEMANKSGDNYSHNTNSNNKTFNLQIFLNETCKDAINLTDFINQINLSVRDLEETGKLGYAEGISKVFIKNLTDIDLTKRPIHCSDAKRETIYIRNENQWSKDDEKKTTLSKAIKVIGNKNMKQITEWQKLHPEYADPHSKQNDTYMEIVLNSMSGSTKEEQQSNLQKIIKNVAKEVVIKPSGDKKG